MSYQEPQFMKELFAQIDAQIREKQHRPPPGDRRQKPGAPPEGMQERRTGIERRKPRPASSIYDREE